MGLCSGAHAAFHAALERLPMDGVILLNPITFYWKPGDLLDVSAWKNYTDVRHYQRSLLDASRWERVLTGKVNLWYPLTVAARRAQVLVTAWGRSLLRAAGALPPSADDLAADLKRLHHNGTGVLLVFSDGDPGLDYLRLHARRAVARLARKSNFAMKVVERTDHTFTPVESQYRLQELLTSHLYDRYVGTPGPGRRSGAHQAASVELEKWRPGAATVRMPERSP